MSVRRRVIEVPVVPLATEIGPMKSGSWRSLKPIYNHDICTKCGNCATYCPEGVVKRTSEGYYLPNYEFCKGCGICANECPSDAIEMVEE